MLPSAYKRLFLRGLYWDALEATPALTLTAALKAAARAQLTPTKSGTVLLATAGNNHSVTFGLPESGRGASPQDITELCSELFDLYDVARQSCITNDAVAVPTDAQILTEMLGRLEAVRECYSDFSGMVRGPEFAS